MAFDRTRTLRGALAGSVAAAVWLAQQPLDKRLFDSGYDDADLLARLVARGGSAQPAVGALLHVQNGALFGAVYANLAPEPARSPRRCAGRSPGCSSTSSTWPAIALVEPSLLRQRPRVRAVGLAPPRCSGSCSASSSARLNPPAADLEPVERGGGRLQRPRLGGAPGREPR